MMMIHFFVKIITTHTHEYFLKILFGHILSTENLCYILLQQYAGDSLNSTVRHMYHRTHTLTISNTNFTHTYTQNKSHTNLNVNICLTVFHITQILSGKVLIQLSSLQLWMNSREDWVLWPWLGNQSRKRKNCIQTCKTPLKKIVSHPAQIGKYTYYD